MSLSPANILQRLQELKLWQESHEELLKKTKNVLNSSEIGGDTSDYRTIEGLSAFDSTIDDHNTSNTNWESQAISPTKSFNELLEEKLKEDPGPVKNDTNRPKRPFLRKGSGLQRFRLQPGQKPKCNKPIKLKPSLRKTTNEARATTPLKVPNLVIKPKATWRKSDDESANHIRKINEIAQIHPTPGLSEQTLYEKALEKELLIFEALEEKAENSSFCSTNSSVLQILSSTPSKLKNKAKQPPILEEKRVHWESQSEEDENDVVIESNLEKQDIAEILLRLQSFTEHNTNTNKVPAITESSEEEKWSTTTDSSQDSSISSTDLEVTLRTEKCDLAVGTNNSEMCAICERHVDVKIKEYEDKIQEVIQDKNRIGQLRKDLEQKKEALEREYNKMKREFEEEKRTVLFDLETERKMLVKEKQLFQARTKDSQNRPNKREREEISNLKQEVADLKETLKLKESKNGMTQARLRNQIKQLEKDNSNLKDEVEKLTKENGKLTAAQKVKRRPSETKILHEINKNISKLTQETIRSKNEVENSPQRRNNEERTSRRESQEEDSLLEMANTRITDYTDIERLYESTFRSEHRQNVSRNDSKSKIETVHEDGSRQIQYPNGNVKTVSSDGNFITMKYFNGDIQETDLIEGTVRYFFYTKKIWQTTYADGFELVEFPDGVKERRYADGKREVILPDDVVQVTLPDGSQETKYPDGSVVHVKSNGDKILNLPNGQREIETRECKRREYPDGTVKILYPDGTQETKYSNGRIRIKDKNGKLLMDTQS